MSTANTKPASPEPAANPGRLGLSPVNADKVVMALSTGDMLDAVNIPLRARRGRLRLDYATLPYPVLMISCPGIDPEPLCRLHTRGTVPWTETLIPRNEALRRMVADIAERTAKIGAALVLAHAKDRQGRKYVRLQLTHADSRYVALTLHGTWKGYRSDWIGPFAEPEPKARAAA